MSAADPIRPADAPRKVALDRARSRDAAARSRLIAIIRERTGIALDDSQHDLLNYRLRPRLTLYGLDTLGDYCDLVEDPVSGSSELPELVDAITTNKTDFFREVEHFDVLARWLKWADGLPPRRTTSGLLKVWSAACSNGAEVYTLAMVLDGLRQAGRAGEYSVLGTDINQFHLRRARAAIYSKEEVRPIPADYASAYLNLIDPGIDVRPIRSAVGIMNPYARIAGTLRKRVAFGSLNLMKTPYPVDIDVDVIFARNVLIYFDKFKQREVVERLRDHLRADGLLFLGMSEASAGDVAELKRCGPSVFRRA